MNAQSEMVIRRSSELDVLCAYSRLSLACGIGCWILCFGALFVLIGVEGLLPNTQSSTELIYSLAYIGILMIPALLSTWGASLGLQSILRRDTRVQTWLAGAGVVMCVGWLILIVAQRALRLDHALSLSCAIPALLSTISATGAAGLLVSSSRSDRRRGRVLGVGAIVSTLGWSWYVFSNWQFWSACDSLLVLGGTIISAIGGVAKLRGKWRRRGAVALAVFCLMALWPKPMEDPVWVSNCCFGVLLPAERREYCLGVPCGSEGLFVDFHWPNDW